MNQKDILKQKKKVLNLALLTMKNDTLSTWDLKASGLRLGTMYTVERSIQPQVDQNMDITNAKSKRKKAEDVSEMEMDPSKLPN